MKIKSLFISKYKNVKNINLEFDSELTLLIGKNGLGKSNLLEALALIFRDLEILEHEDDLNNWAYNENYFEYELKYECKGNDIKVQCMEGLFRFSERPLNSEKHFNLVDFGSFKRHRKEKYLPDFVIGYYSGENKRIGSLISKHEQIQFGKLRNLNRSANSNKEDDPMRKVFFTQNFHSQLLLLTLVAFNDYPFFGNKVSELIDEYLRIDSIINFDIKFNNPDWKYTSINKINKGADFLIENINSREEVQFPFWNVKGKVDMLLTRFYNHLIEKGKEPIIYPNENGEDDRNFVREFILFNDINFTKFKEELGDYISAPLDFFDALEASSVLEVLADINFTVKKRDHDFFVNFNELSEGEQQLITTLGLLLIFGEKDCLYLLDEPDTHLNPTWQRDFVRLIEKFNLNKNGSHIFVATHSPLIVQAAEGADMLLYKSSGNGNVIIENNKSLQIHNWRIDQVLASEFFEFTSTRPPSLDNFMVLREKILANGLDENTEDVLKKLENDFGVLPTGETIDEIESLRLIKSITDRINNVND